MRLRVASALLLLGAAGPRAWAGGLVAPVKVAVPLHGSGAGGAAAGLRRGPTPSLPAGAGISGVGLRGTLGGFGVLRLAAPKPGGTALPASAIPQAAPGASSARLSPAAPEASPAATAPEAAAARLPLPPERAAGPGSALPRLSREIESAGDALPSVRGRPNRLGLRFRELNAAFAARKELDFSPAAGPGASFSPVPAERVAAAPSGERRTADALPARLAPAAGLEPGLRTASHGADLVAHGNPSLAAVTPSGERGTAGAGRGVDPVGAAEPRLFSADPAKAPFPLSLLASRRPGDLSLRIEAAAPSGERRTAGAYEGGGPWAAAGLGIRSAARAASAGFGYELARAAWDRQPLAARARPAAPGSPAIPRFNGGSYSALRRDSVGVALPHLAPTQPGASRTAAGPQFPRRRPAAAAALPFRTASLPPAAAIPAALGLLLALLLFAPGRRPIPLY